mmetsp:Transcript_36590/g.80133  ORF Transcript_36590/g.80133 Transcript_36590/m.80133 type:complete len:346 (-) Transcript_36590:65-1102(-)
MRLAWRTGERASTTLLRAWLPPQPLRPATIRHFAAASVPASVVKELRDRTGASMGKCREALREEDGNVEKAVEWLRKRGIRSMERRTADAAEALLALSVGATAGAIVEVRAETDFVTRSDLFQQLTVALAATAASHNNSVDLAREVLQTSEAVSGQVSPGATVGTALLELGSVLGERILLQPVRHLAAPEGGVLAGYMHPKQADGLPGTGKAAALVALRPAERGDEERLRLTAAQLARHIVAMQPRFVSIASVPKEVLEKEQASLKEAHLAQLDPKRAQNIDEAVLAKVIDGKTKKFFQDTVLLSQELLLPQAEVPITVEAWLKEEAKAAGVSAVSVDAFELVLL